MVGERVAWAPFLRVVLRGDRVAPPREVQALEVEGREVAVRVCEAGVMLLDELRHA